MKLPEPQKSSKKKYDKSFDLTIKQRKWLEVYISSGNATEAAMQAYDCKDRDSARAMGSENLAKLNISEFLEESGLTDKLLVDKLKEGLDSNRTISARIILKKNSSTSQAVGESQATTQTDDFIDVPDMLARHKYLETAYKLKGKFVEKAEISGNASAPFTIKIIADKLDGSNITDTELPETAGDI